MRIFTFLSVVILLYSCSGKPSEPHREVNAVKIIPIDEDQVFSVMENSDSSYVFLATTWCRGGKMTLHNMVLPFLEDMKGENIAPYIFIISDFDKGVDKFASEIEVPLTIYQVKGLMFDNALFHKLKIRSIMKSMNSDYSYPFGVPVCFFYNRENKGMKEGTPERFFEKQTEKKQ